MSAFVIGQMDIHNSDWTEEYFAKVPALIESHGGRFLVRGGDPENLEGGKVPDAAFIIEFPDRDHARAFWNDEAFQPLVALRQTGSTLNAVLVDRLPLSQ